MKEKGSKAAEQESDPSRAGKEARAKEGASNRAGNRSATVWKLAGFASAAIQVTRAEHHFPNSTHRMCVRRFGKGKVIVLLLLSLGLSFSPGKFALAIIP